MQTKFKTQAIEDNAITTPKIADAQVTQSKLAPGIGGNPDHSFRINKGSLQAIPTNTETIVIWDEVGGGDSFDTDNLHSDSVNPSRITITSATAGKWLLTGIIMFPDSQSERFARILMNGLNIATASTHISSGINQGMLVTTIRGLSAGDYIEMSCFHTDGVTRSIDGVPKGRSTICGIRVAS